MAVEDGLLLLPEEEGLSQDQRAELWLGALVCGLIVLLLSMVVFIVAQAWPSFAHNGLHWFGSGGNVDQQIEAIFNSTSYLHKAVYTFHAWPLIWSTILTTVGAAVISFVLSLFFAIFMVEFAPAPLQRVLEPVVRVLASVPSVIYGLDRRARAGAVHRQPPRHPERERIGRARHLTHRRESAGGSRDPDGDDRADHDLDLRRRAAGHAAKLDRGVAGARGEPLAHLLERGGAERPSGPCRGHSPRRRDGRWASR